MNKILVYILPLSMFFQFHFIGTFTGADILSAFIILLAFLSGSKFKITKIEKQFYLFGFLWLIGQILSDMYNGSSAHDYLRGWANISVFIMIFTAVRYVAAGSLKRITIMAALYFLAGALKLKFGLSDDPLLKGKGLAILWKFGYGQCFSVFILLLAADYMRKPATRVFGIILPFAGAAIALYMNARTLFGMTALAGLVNALLVGRKKEITKPQLIFILLAVFISGMVILSVYAYTASHGLLGHKAFVKYAVQSAGTSSPLGILLSGRSEIFASLQAVADAPIMGHGSWAHDYKYALIRLLNMAASGREVAQGPIDSSLIPSHSYLFGAWVMGGILGAVFWIWALQVAIKGGFAILRHKSVLTGFYCFIGMGHIWNILFSPFGIDARLTTSVNLYLLMMLLNVETAQKTQAAGQGPGNIKIQKNDEIAGKM